MSSKKDGPWKFLNKTPAKHRDIFRDTPFAKKYGEGEDRIHDLLAGKHEKLHSPNTKNYKHSPGSNPLPTGWENNKWSALHSTEWDKVEFWQNL